MNATKHSINKNIYVKSVASKNMNLEQVLQKNITTPKLEKWKRQKKLVYSIAKQNEQTSTKFNIKIRRWFPYAYSK